jgi:hypothetical protein
MQVAHLNQEMPDTRCNTSAAAWGPASLGSRFLMDSCLSCTEPVPCRTHLTSILHHGIPWAKGAAAPFSSRKHGTRHSENMR